MTRIDDAQLSMAARDSEARRIHHAHKGRCLELHEAPQVQSVLEPGETTWKWQTRARTEQAGNVPSPDPAPGAPPEAAVQFDVPGVGDVWLVPDSAAAEKLGVPAGQWLVPPDLALLEGLTPDERVQVQVWMRETGGRLVAAPAPARRFGPGEKGWSRWRIENLDAQIREYRGRKGEK